RRSCLQRCRQVRLIVANGVGGATAAGVVRACRPGRGSMGGTVAATTKHGRLIFKACIECKAPLGPWDERACVSHRTDFRFTSIADVAAAVLERSERPLPVHDVARIARRDLGASLVRGSLTSIMGAERRF